MILVIQLLYEMQIFPHKEWKVDVSMWEQFNGQDLVNLLQADGMNKEIHGITCNEKNEKK